MDKFRQANNDIATAYDLYDTFVCYGSTTKAKDKKMLRGLSRTRLKEELKKDIKDGVADE